MGNQNAFLARYEGMTSRVSHITGYLTDAAVYLGRIMRGSKRDVYPFGFLIFKTLSFLIGALFGCYLIRIDRRLHLILPAALYIFAGFFYYVYIYRKNVEEEVLIE